MKWKQIERFNKKNHSLGGEGEAAESLAALLPGPYLGVAQMQIAVVQNDFTGPKPGNHERLNTFKRRDYSQAIGRKCMLNNFLEFCKYCGIFSINS